MYHYWSEITIKRIERRAIFIIKSMSLAVVFFRAVRTLKKDLKQWRHD